MSIARLAHAVFVRDAVRDVVAVGPHSESGKLAYGDWAAARLLAGDMHFDPGALCELHVFKRFEDATLVLGGDGHRVRPRNSKDTRMARRGAPSGPVYASPIGLCLFPG